MQSAKQALKCALITGSGRRIGRAIASDLAKLGWAVAIHYRRSTDEAQTLASEINGLGGTAKCFRADLSDIDDTKRLFADAAEALGPVTTLINNASEFLPDTIETLDEKSWDLHQSINLKAPIFLAQALAQQLSANGHVTGNIINIIDQRVWNLTPDFFSYTISKAGLWTATRTLAQALAPRIRVNAIAPGPTLKSTHQTADEFARETQTTLLGCGPTTDEIAAAVRFILATPSLTGQMIALDGGQHLVRSQAQP